MFFRFFVWCNFFIFILLENNFVSVDIILIWLCLLGVVSIIMMLIGLNLFVLNEMLCCSFSNDKFNFFVFFFGFVCGIVNSGVNI